MTDYVILDPESYNFLDCKVCAAGQAYRQMTGGAAVWSGRWPNNTTWGERNDGERRYGVLSDAAGKWAEDLADRTGCPMADADETCDHNLVAALNAELEMMNWDMRYVLRGASSPLRPLSGPTPSTQEIETAAAVSC